MSRDQSSVGSKFSGEVDPEIAGLMGIETPELADRGDEPEFLELFEEDAAPDGDLPGSPEGADTASRAFRRPEKIEEAAKPFFQDREFYKTVLSGEGDVSKKLHSFFSSFMTVQDPQERSVFRGRLIPVYWELLGRLSVKMTRNLPMPKRLFARYAVLLPTAISTEQRDMLARIVWDNGLGEPIYYLDEWISAVIRGQVSPSVQDETKQARRDDKQKMQVLLERTRGRFEAQVGLIRNRMGEMDELEERLRERVRYLTEHETASDLPGLKLPYSEAQRSALNEIGEVLRRLGNVNRDQARYYSELDGIRNQLEDLKRKDQELGAGPSVDNKTILDELNTLRQMAKMCVGRQGNHFPILLKQYIRGNILDIGTRENLVNIMADVEYLDPGLFLRSFRQQTNRIVPNIIILPCYGDAGICWEPFERYNRATGRGRVAIPLYPKEIRTAVIAAMADLRWQVAKEKAQHYWMEEGLTGWYYQWFSERKMKGDVRESFIQDYILWISKESEGTQKLDREVRGIFWRYLPFPQDVKDKLKTRGFVYAELYKKDQNRAMSDGY